MRESRFKRELQAFSSIHSESQTTDPAWGPGENDGENDIVNFIIKIILSWHLSTWTELFCQYFCQLSMSRKKRYVESLTETEVLTLEQGFKHGPAVDFRQRCQLLLLSNKGYEVKQIVDVLEVCSHTLYSTMKSWREDGIAGLIRKKGQGRKATLQVDNARHVEATRKAVERHAQNSEQILEELYAELDIAPLSKRSLQRFLKKTTTAGNASEDGSRSSHQLLKSKEKQKR